MPILSLDGADIFYEVRGQGRPLVFIHGLGSTSMSWWRQMAKFASTHTCVTFSARGYPPSSGRADAAVFPADVVRLCDHLQLDHPVLVGQSMGGWVALVAALQFPQRFGGVLVASTVALQAATDLRAELAHAALDTTPLTDRGILPFAGERLALEQPEAYELLAEMETATSQVGRPHVAKQIRSLYDYQAHDVIGLDVPVRCLVGEEDAMTRSDVQVALARRVGWHVDLIQRAGHSPFVERPQECNERLAEFLRDLDTSPSKEKSAG